MKSAIMVFSLLYTASSFAGGFTCSNADAGGQMSVAIDDSQRAGTLTIDNEKHILSCEGGLGFVLECKAYASRSHFEVAIHRFHTHTEVLDFSASVRQFIDVLDGSPMHDLGTVQCEFPN